MVLLQPSIYSNAGRDTSVSFIFILQTCRDLTALSCMDLKKRDYFCLQILARWEWDRNFLKASVTCLTTSPVLFGKLKANKTLKPRDLAHVYSFACWRTGWIRGMEPGTLQVWVSMCWAAAHFHSDFNQQETCHEFLWIWGPQRHLHKEAEYYQAYWIQMRREPC